MLKKPLEAAAYNRINRVLNCTCS